MTRPKKVTNCCKATKDKVTWSDLSFPLQVQVMFSWIMSGLIIASSIIVMLK